METGELEYEFQTFRLVSEEENEEMFYSPIPSPDFSGFNCNETAEFCRQDTRDIFRKCDDDSDSELDDEYDERVHISLRNVPLWLGQDLQILASAWLLPDKVFPAYQFPSEYYLHKEQRKLTVNEMMLIRRYALIYLHNYVEQQRETKVTPLEWFHLDHWASTYINRMYLYHFFV